MEQFKRVVLWVNWALSMLAAVAIVVLSVRHLEAGESASTLVIIGGIAAVLIFVLEILFLLGQARGTRRQIYLHFQPDEEAAPVKVSVAAIEEALTRTAVSQPELYDGRVRVVLEKSGALPSRAEVHCVFWDVPDIFAVQDTTRAALEARYQEIFPNQDLKFEIFVDRLRPKKEAAERGPDEPTNGIEAPFTGPRYPVSD